MSSLITLTAEYPNTMFLTHARFTPFRSLFRVTCRVLFSARRFALCIMIIKPQRHLLCETVGGIHDATHVARSE
jgi:hypothetical protein